MWGLAAFLCLMSLLIQYFGSLNWSNLKISSRALENSEGHFTSFWFSKIIFWHYFIELDNCTYSRGWCYYWISLSCPWTLGHVARRNQKLNNKAWRSLVTVLPTELKISTHVQCNGLNTWFLSLHYRNQSHHYVLRPHFNWLFTTLRKFNNWPMLPSKNDHLQYLNLKKLTLVVFQIYVVTNLSERGLVTKQTFRFLLKKICFKIIKYHMCFRLQIEHRLSEQSMIFFFF